jgi:tRNA A-37 threonylcarbamoyl transferase component Bud32
VGVRLLLDKALAPALAAAGLNSAAALFRLGGDAEAQSVVTTVELPVEGTSGRFHLKRYRYPGWGTSKGLLGRGTLFGTAPEVREFRNLAFLREKGVPAVRPVAAASETRSLRLVAHVLLTEHVTDGVDLARRLAQPGDPVREDPAVRRRVAELLGRNVHRMHLEGFVHRDLFARNVVVRVEEDTPFLWLCDCRRGGPPSMRRKTVDDLATLDLDLQGRMSRTDRLRALRGYTGTGAIGKFVAKIAARRERLRRALA